MSKFVAAQAGESPLPPGAKPDPNPHPREAAMEGAGNELNLYLKDWAVRHGLTLLEFLYLTAVPRFQQIQAHCLKEREARDRAVT